VSLAALALSFVESFGGAPGSWMVGAILFAIFICAALGMEFYLHRYVVALDGTREALEVETLSTLGRRRRLVPWSDVAVSESRRDVFIAPGAPIVDNSAARLRLKGSRSALIIDTTEDELDVAALSRSRTSHV
jgi:hypothetical protein